MTTSITHELIGFDLRENRSITMPEKGEIDPDIRENSIMATSDQIEAPTQVERDREIERGKRRVLILSDDRATVTYFEYVSDRLGFQFEEAENWEDAVDLLNKNLPDCLIVDSRQKTKIRSTELGELKYIPKIAVTQRYMKRLTKDSLRNGFDDCISAPFTFKKCRKILNRNSLRSAGGRVLNTTFVDRINQVRQAFRPRDLFQKHVSFDSDQDGGSGAVPVPGEGTPSRNW